MAINNYGRIERYGVGESAIDSEQDGATIANYGQLIAHGDGGNGILAEATSSVTVRNYGQITTTGNGGVGILAESDNAVVTNTGTVQTTGGYSDTYGTADGADIYGDNGRLTHNGGISVGGDDSAGMVDGGNTGVLTNTGLVTASGADAYGLVLFGGSGGTLLNAGTVVMSAAYGTGIGISGADRSATNSGLIVDTAGDFSAGVSASGTSLTVNNRGQIQFSGAAEGIGILAVGEDNVMTNWGSIAASNADFTGMAAAISATRGGVDIQLINRGSIALTGAYDAGITNGTTHREVVPGSPDGDAGSGGPISGGLTVNAGSIVTHGAASVGVEVSGAGQQVVNAGHIETFGGYAAANAGDAHTATGLLAAGSALVALNEKSGSIVTHDPSSPAVQLNTVDGAAPDLVGASVFENDGTIRASANAIVGGASAEAVLNYGTIFGNVSLGGGDDTYLAGAGGTLSGVLYTGAGHDTVILAKGAGKTVVGDFQAGPGAGDVADVSAYHFANFAQIKAAAHQVGADTWITLSPTDTLVLQHVSVGSLAADDFDLTPTAPTWDATALQHLHAMYDGF